MRSRAAVTGSLRASAAISASVRPTASSLGAAAFAISICSGPRVPRMFSQPGSPCAMSREIRRRVARSAIAVSVPGAPPSCAQPGRMLASSVLPAP